MYSFLPATMKRPKEKNREKVRKKSSRDTLWHVSTDFSDDNRSFSSMTSAMLENLTSPNSVTTQTPSIVGMSPAANTGTNRIELTEQLTPKRPLRSEHERRVSRPPSTLTNGSVLSLDSNLTEGELCFPFSSYDFCLKPIPF